MNKTTVIVCDKDVDTLDQIRRALQAHREFELLEIFEAPELISTARANQPCVVIVNPDMNGFDEEALCTQLMQSGTIPVLLLLDPGSSHRATLGNCQADDVVEKPIVAGNLLNLVLKHISVHQ